ncbi:hypothetical protein [Terrimonas pollutisoli]|uniref:hypothetical protein n=1 Tax=Terrimonas pollutisoli TaxID=3034147 RepID=UPI0023EB812F|nr:hypothetical protein [Terrimonas sp. H1YJ31]
MICLYLNLSILRKKLFRFEAHCLAIIAGFILLLKRKSPDAAFFNKAGIAIHGILGISNITWFQIFLDTNTLPMGYLTTLIYFLFVMLHAIAIQQKNQQRYHPVQIDGELK